MYSPKSPSLLCTALLGLSCAPALLAQAPKPAPRMTPDGLWPVHSMERPRPEVVPPQYDGTPRPAPTGAVILLDGTSLSQWKRAKTDPANPKDDAPWKLENGFMEVVPKTGTVVTRIPLSGDGHLHIEWATPATVSGNGQGRGNSGVFIGGYPEVQVLDSWKNDTYPDGQAGALYGLYPPLVNASRPPGEWQAYDIVLTRAKVQGDTVLEKQRLSVWHNGVLIQDHVALEGRAQEGTLSFQDHGNPVRFRNIWFQPFTPKRSGAQ
ncbi:MAG: hypothetical protein RLZZ244_1554 [Verrucomicrobiota bacterium]|jgi:hypothetical protein